MKNKYEMEQARGISTLQFLWAWCELAAAEEEIKCREPVHAHHRGVRVDMPASARLEEVLAVVTQNHNFET